MSENKYKTERIIDIQKTAIEKGIEEWKLKTMLAWLMQENGSFSENTRGDYGHSVGLCMCHTKYRKCVFTYDEQKEQCLNWFKVYTAFSTKHSIYKDIKTGHNPRAGVWYDNGIKKKENLFIN